MTAKVQLQLLCDTCEAFVNATVTVDKVAPLVAGFNNLHPAKCFEEKPDGEEEAEPAAGAAKQEPDKADREASGEPIH